MEIFTGTLLVLAFFFIVLLTRRAVAARIDLAPVTPNKQRHIDEMEAALAKNRFAELSGLELARMIREGEASSLEITEAHIRHTKAVNHHINAVVADRFAEALKEARSCDEELERRRGNGTDLSDLPAFYGVPCTVKECFALKGMPQASGLVSRKNLISQEDATVVQRLRDAGAIPIGVTNTSELCMWIESANKVYGRTRNPFDPSRIVGGSSGGEGSIIGSGASPFGIGSDIGGSIRMPAFFNGVFGHKPSGGLVPGTGQHPIADGEALKFLTTGPLARKAADLWPLLKIMRGPDGLDKGCVETANDASPADVDVSSLTVYWLDSNENAQATPVSGGMRRALHEAIEYLRDECGCKTIHAKHRLYQLKYSLDIWSAMLQEGNSAQSFGDMMANGDKRFSPWKELLIWLFKGDSDYTMPALALCLIEKMQHVAPQRTAKFVEKGKKLKQQVNELLDEKSILLYPSYPTAAPRHGEPIFWPVNWQYTAIWNMMQVPVTQVPVGLTWGKELPLGVQVIGQQGNDHVTIAVAEKLEQGPGGWELPALVRRNCSANLPEQESDDDE